MWPTLHLRPLLEQAERLWQVVKCHHQGPGRDQARDGEGEAPGQDLQTGCARQAQQARSGKPRRTQVHALMPLE